MTTYSTRLTNAGAIALNDAITANTAVALDAVAVGDANGADYVPDGSEAALINEQHRLPLASIAPHPANANWLVLEAVLPPDVGGWWIREVGVFDDNDDLFAIANFPPTYKPMVANGAASSLTIQIVLQVSSTNALTLSVDAGEGYATQTWIEAAYPWTTEEEAADEAIEHKIVDPKRLAHVLALLDAAPRDELQALSDAVDLALQGKADSDHTHPEFLTAADKAADAALLDGLGSDQFLRSDEAGTVSGNLTVEGELHVGKDGGGDSNLHFYDDNSNTERTIQWDDSVNRFRIEEEAGWTNLTQVRCWVRFDGSGTLSVKSSFNVASVSDKGTGYYRVNIDKDMDNGNYAVVIGGARDSNLPGFIHSMNHNAGYFELQGYSGSTSGKADWNIVSAAVLAT
ncbi:phage tail protein [uncultured Cohaesibacter sp.]|uniref:phage tail protein n=1 Tax=uncultured Cohaesibacter sp. TaxID=1002546 RepID=UPI0029C60351|nr:phage tail protein [uncultured Cohaesibacter sp.]